MLNLEIRDPSVNLSYLQYAEGLSRFLMTEAILFTVNTLELLVIIVV